MVNDSEDSPRTGKKGLTEQQLALRTQVMSFFERLQSELGLSGLKKDVFAELIKQVNRDLDSGQKPYDPSLLRRFQQKNPKVKQEIFERIKLAIPGVRIWQKHPDVRALYEEIFGLKFAELAPNRAIFNFQTDDRRPLTEEDNILGDYLLFRSEGIVGKSNNLISRSFFRFYRHRNGHIRSMGLWLDKAHGYLSSKGWVVNPDNYHLVVGHVVDRIGENLVDIRRGGGSTTMTIRHSEPNRYTVINRENDVPRIQCAPVMHFRATSETEPSYSNGVLIRLYGVEKEGGNADTPKAERYHAIRQLQEKLSDRCHPPLTLHKAATQLAQATGFSSKVFYQKSGEDGLPVGLLVNRPTVRATTPHTQDEMELVFGANEFGDFSEARIDTKRARGPAGIHFTDIDG